MTKATGELNIYSKSKDARSRLLSNFAETPFELEGIQFCSLEGMLQGIKFPEGDARREQTFEMSGLAAKRMGRKATRSGFVYFGGRTIEFGSEAHRALLDRGLEAKFTQCADARAALLATGDLPLVHRVAAFARRKAKQPTNQQSRSSQPTSRLCQTLTALRTQIRDTFQAV